MSSTVGTASQAPSLETVLSARLASVSPGRYRRRRVVFAPDVSQPVRVRIDGRPCVSFCSNDYLGLAANPELIEACAQAASRYGVGSGASHLITGHGPEHEALEHELAAFTGRSRALVFSTGYMANLGLASALFAAGDSVFEDRLNHASLLDAGLGSHASFRRYAHADTAALERRLERHPASLPASCAWVVTDGVFSMEGDIAPLASMAVVARKYAAHLVVDDAHGFGVLGRQGRGSVDAAGLDAAAVPVLMGTLGKALGTFGAFVAGSDSLIEMLIQRARTYLYTTAMPPPIAAATRVALRLAQAGDDRRQRLERHIATFRAHALARGWPLLPSTTPIQPLMLGSEERTLDASAALLSQGILVSAIRPPTVPEGGARLRITFSAAHDDGDVERLLAALSRLQWPEAGA